MKDLIRTAKIHKQCSVLLQYKNSAEYLFHIITHPSYKQFLTTTACQCSLKKF